MAIYLVEQGIFAFYGGYSLATAKLIHPASRDARGPQSPRVDSPL